MKKIRIGITGSTGFVGSAVLKHLLQTRGVAIKLDDRVHPDKKPPRAFGQERLDWILHFGATKSIDASFERPVEIYRRNLQSTLTALEIAAAMKSRFLYMSSYVYGNPAYLPVDEKHPTSILNPYMGSKLLGEQICSHVHQLANISVLILRGFTLYGPLQRDVQFIPSVVDSIRNGKPIIVNNPNPIRDYLHIDDFVRLISKIVSSGFSGFDIYNVGGGKPYKNIEVARMAVKLAGNRVPVNIINIERRNDVAECYADIAKVSRDFKWNPEMDLLSGLKNCMEQDLIFE